jgi:uncharacterized protein (TIGR03066 family)
MTWVQQHCYGSISSTAKMKTIRVQKPLAAFSGGVPMPWFRCLLLGCLALGLAGCGSKANGLANTANLGEQIVGTWEVTKAGSYMPEGSTLEFGKDGKLKVVAKLDEKETTEWTYTIEGDRITLLGPEAAKQVLKINKLTDTELVTEDATGETGIVTGFTYTSNLPLRSVFISKPLRGGQKSFELVVGDKTFPLEAGKRFHFTSVFPEGVTAFVIRGIEESEGLVYGPGEIERTTTPRPATDRPLGHHHRGSFPTGVSPLKDGSKPQVMMVPIFKVYPTEYKRRELANKDKTAGT